MFNCNFTTKVSYTTCHSKIIHIIVLYAVMPDTDHLSLKVNKEKVEVTDLSGCFHQVHAQGSG